MIRILWDENTSHHFLRGVKRARPDLDVVTVQQLGLTGASDATVLDRAVADNRVLVTHDRTTIPAYIRARIESGATVPGVVIARIEQTSLRALIDALIFVIDAAEPDDWQYPIFIP